MDQGDRDFYEEESFVREKSRLGDLLTFNVEYGFLEGVVRGFRSGFLSDTEYRQLTQCETLEDFKVTLADTDYYSVLQTIQKLTPESLLDKCWDKFNEEFQFLKSQAVGHLNTFLNFITYEYMLDNITLLIKSLASGSSGEKVLSKLDNLGKFPHMSTLLSFTPTEEGFQDLYNLLIDTPVAPYFAEYFESAQEVKATFNETDLEIITNMLKKYWLEDFYSYCNEIGGTTAEIMKELLEFEADRRAISITFNSFGLPLNSSAAMRENERKDLFCNFGTLYPEGIEAFSNVTEFASLRAVLEKYEQFNRILQIMDSEGKELEPDIMQQEEVALCRKAFEQQGHFACFYGFVKLKLQEKNNLYWIIQCIIQNQQKSSAINRWISIFPPTVNIE